MKKATTSAAISAAPAKPEAKAPPKPEIKAPAKRASTPPVKAPKKAVSVAPTPAPAAVVTTTVVARVDVGFGNLLHLRGEGPGLSWDQGVPMECVSSDTWTWTSAAVSRPFAYKVLVNDEQWSAGDDFVATVGAENTISPVF